MANEPEITSDANDERYVRDLAWKMLDECIDEEEMEQLDLLLAHSESARAAYVRIVQMHVDLLDHFGSLPNSTDFLEKMLAQSPSQPAPPIAPLTGGIATSEPTGA